MTPQTTTPDYDPNGWKEYQPARARDKTWYDIRLRDGTELICCYPNGVHWHHPSCKSIADYRVTHIRITQNPIDIIEERNSL